MKTKGLLLPFEPTILVFLALVILTLSLGPGPEVPAEDVGMTHVTEDSLDCIREEETLARGLYLFLYGDGRAVPLASAIERTPLPARGPMTFPIGGGLPGPLPFMVNHPDYAVNCLADGNGTPGPICPGCNPLDNRRVPAPPWVLTSLLLPPPDSKDEREIAQKHLRAYVNALSVQGFDYQPRFISRELFAALTEP